MILVSCGPSPGPVATPAAEPSTAVQMSGGKPNLTVIDNDFSGRGGVKVFSWETKDIKIITVSINGKTIPDCYFDSGTEMTGPDVNDVQKLPAQMERGTMRRPPFFLLSSCGEPKIVVITTDRGSGEYPVTDPDQRSAVTQF